MWNSELQAVQETTGVHCWQHPSTGDGEPDQRLVANMEELIREVKTGGSPVGSDHAFLEISVFSTTGQIKVESGP